MKYGDRVLWHHDGRTWLGTVVGKCDGIVVVELDEDGLSYDVPRDQLTLMPLTDGVR